MGPSIDIELLSKGTNASQFYSAKNQKCVNVHAEIFVTLQDQPERRSANYVCLGNGTYTSRFGYAADLCAVSTGIPACDKCLESIPLNEDAINMTNNNNCPNCVLWSIDSDSGKLDFLPPQHFPKD